ncbi:hypothetical protein ACFQO4_19105 [Saliphagus sp. GCM10025334]|uniref:hypothetical protein n=1 Tax=Natronosalvus caseinilyticus TaxID=2953747 RepID=UPI0028A8960E|nr:hypothetical protein [Natronosalvus caseinilyticus]
MNDEMATSTLNAATLQEAVDTIVQMLDHPSDISISYSFNGETKTTLFQVGGPEEASYELVYEGEVDENEPTIQQIE